MVVVEGAGGEGEEDEGDDELVLRLRLDLTFRVEGELLGRGGVGSGEGCLDVLCVAVGEDELTEVEVERSSAPEAASCLGFAICFAALVALKYFPTLPLVYLMVLTQGALGYGLTSIMGAVVVEIFQGKHYGSIFGTIMIAALAGGAAGPWVTGVLHDFFGDYTLAFVIGIGVSGLSAIAIWQAGPRRIRAVAGQLHKVQRVGG